MNMSRRRVPDTFFNGLLNHRSHWKTGSHEFGDICARILRGFGEFTFEDSGRTTFQHVALRLGVEP